MRLVQKYAVLVFICLCPIIYNPFIASAQRDFQQTSFQMMAMMLVTLFARNIWITCFFFLNIVLFIFSGSHIGQEQVYNIFFGIVLFMVMRRYFRFWRAELELRPLLWVGVLSITFMALQNSGVDPLLVMANNAGDATTLRADTVGLFAYKAAHAVFLALLIPIIFSFNAWLPLLLFIPIWKCFSSAGYLAATVSYGFCLFYLKRKIFKIAAPIALVILGCFMFFNDYKGDPGMFVSRFHPWHAAIRYSLKNPFGYGPDSYRHRNDQKNFLFLGDQQRNLWVETKNGDQYARSYYHPNIEKKTKPRGKVLELLTNPDSISWNFWDNPHNEYIQMLFEYGVVGVILLIGLIRDMVRRFNSALNTRLRDDFKKKEVVIVTACLLVYFVSGLTQFPLHLARTGCLFPILLGAYYAITDRGSALDTARNA